MISDFVHRASAIAAFRYQNRVSHYAALRAGITSAGIPRSARFLYFFGS